MSAKIPPLVALARLIDSVNAWLGRICAWLPIFLVIGTALVVLLRYGFGIGATGLQEAVMYAHALVFMGAAAWALQQGAHVRVDILYQRFSARTKEAVNLFGTLVLLLPTCGFLLWLSWSYVGASWATLEGSPEAGGLPFVYLQKSIILVLVVSLLLQAISALILGVYRLAGRIPFEEHTEVQHG
ncbi:MAG TPA: TRAP transporter small permease subunit [Pseudomonas sp.]|nr:TRAP transporter small permease subunit [Pseudomonas sp.]